MKIAEIYLAKEMKPAEPAHADDEKGIQLSPEQLKANVGTYLNQEDQVIRILVKDNKLQGSMGNEDQSYELKALAPNRFRLVIAPVDLTFETAKPGDPIKLTIKSEDGKPDVYTSVPSFTPAETQLKSYAGIYSSEEIDPLYTLKLEESKLVLHRLKADPDKLMPVTPDLFLASVGSIKFTRDAKGEITGFLLTTGRIRNMRFIKGRPAIAAR